MVFIEIMLAAAALAFIAVAGFLYLAPETATRWAIDSERRRAGLVRKEIVLPGNLKFVYLEGGQGEPLMLLHGFGANKDNFSRVAAQLTPRYRVIVPDLIGFGESAHPQDADYAPKAQAERLRAFSHALGVSTLDLGGSSMGGHIALTYAAMYPAEVKSLWLLDPGGVWSAPSSEVHQMILKDGTNLLMARSEADFARTFEIVMSDPPFIPRPMLNIMARERIQNFALEERIFQQLVRDSVEERSTRVAAPALIVWGDQDRVLDMGGAAILHKLMPQSTVVIMPGVGHLPMLERPKTSGQDYLRFRASVSSSGGNSIQSKPR